MVALRKDDVSDQKLIEQAAAREKSVNLLENRLHNVSPGSVVSESLQILFAGGEVPRCCMPSC